MKRKRITPVTPAVTPGDRVLYLTTTLQAAKDAVAAEEAALPYHMEAVTDDEAPATILSGWKAVTGNDNFLATPPPAPWQSRPAKQI
jgi:hypothetical protein